MTSAQVRGLLDETIEDVALVLDGIFTSHDVGDDVVWQVMKHLDVSHSQALEKLERSSSLDPEPGPSRRAAKPHPAIDALLMKLKLKRGGES